MCAVICRKATVALPDANYLSSWCQSPSSRAQNRHFCALLPFGTPVFRVFEHKIEVFVRFWGLEPSFSGFSSTKSGFLCSRGGECGIVKRNRGDAYHFAAAPTLSHQRTDTSAPTPAHQHQRTDTSAPAPANRHQRTSPATAPHQWYQAPSSAVLAPCSAVLAPSSAIWRRQVLSRRLLAPSGTVLAPCSAVRAPSSAVLAPCTVLSWCRQVPSGAV